MHSFKAASLALLPLVVGAFGCGGKLMDIPANGYEPIDEDASLEGGSQGSSGASSSSSSSSGGSSSSSGGPTTCGGEICDLKTQVCCVAAMGVGDAGSSQKCTATADCTGFALSCADSSDCPTNEACCFTISIGGGLGGLGGGTGGAGGFGGTSSCQASCKSNGLLPSLQLCSKDSECPKGVTCQSIGMGGSACGGLGAFGGGGTAGALGGGTLGGGILGGG
jgi:hypothetical protein